MLDTKYFDKVSAAEALEAIIAERSQAFSMNANLADQHLASINTVGIAVQQTGSNRKVYRIGPSGDDGHVDTELVIRMQGIVSTVDLVLPGNIMRLDTSKVGRLSQKIQLVGEGSPLFEKAVRNTRAIRDVFARFFAGHKCAEWNVGQHDGRSYINASCHYFTATADEPQAVAVPFAVGTDPMGVSQRVLLETDGSLVHAEDNVVEYFKLDVDEETRAPTYYSTFPGLFRPGDIVEIHGTVMAFMNGQGIVKQHFHLQTVTLLEAKFSKAAETARLQDIVKIPRPVTTLRRRYPYEQEDPDVKGARKKFKALKVGGEDSDLMEGVQGGASGA